MECIWWGGVPKVDPAGYTVVPARAILCDGGLSQGDCPERS